MPNRILRDWTDSEALEKAVAGGGPLAETFFVRLIMKADDYGRFSANPKLLNSLLFPLRDGLRDSDMARCLAACEGAGLIRQYAVENKPFVEIVNFGQRVQGKSKFPPPPGVNDENPPLTTVSHGEKPPYSESESESKREHTHQAPVAREPDRPESWPENEEQVRSGAPMRGVDPEFALEVWNDLSGNGGVDWNGNAVTSFWHHAKYRFSKAQGRKEEQKQRGKISGKPNGNFGSRGPFNPDAKPKNPIREF